MAEGESLSWQEAVAKLSVEREQAVAAVKTIVRLGEAGAIEQAALTYAQGRAAMDAAIAALLVALEKGDEGKRCVIEPQLEAAAKARATLTKEAVKHAKDRGARSGVLAELAPLAEPLITALSAAVGALFWHWRGRRDAERAAIKERLEAARWPAFDFIGAP